MLRVWRRASPNPHRETSIIIFQRHWLMDAKTNQALFYCIFLLHCSCADLQYLVRISTDVKLMLVSNGSLFTGRLMHTDCSCATRSSLRNSISLPVLIYDHTYIFCTVREKMICIHQICEHDHLNLFYVGETLNPLNQLLKKMEKNYKNIFYKPIANVY